jgi:hypothetical protein
MPNDPKDPRVAWWLDHVMHTRMYVGGVFNKKPEQAINAINGLWKGVIEWGKLTDSRLAAPIMGEHTILAKLFTDSAARGFQDKEMDYLVGYLMGNKNAQVGLYGQVFDNFPAGKFDKLFSDHISHTGAYIATAAAGDMKSSDAHWAQVQQNAKDLAMFWLNVIPVENIQQDMGDWGEEMPLSYEDNPEGRGPDVSDLGEEGEDDQVGSDVF